MIKLKTEKYFRVIILVLMGIVFLPIVSNHLPLYIGSWKIWLIIWNISLVFLKTKVLWNKLMLTVLLYALFLWLMINTIWIHMDSWNIQMLKNELFYVYLGVSFISYFDVTRDYVGLAKVTKYTLIFICITAFMTIYASFLNPMFIRYLGMESFEGEISKQMQFTLGTGGYGTVIGFMGLLPVLIYYLKNQYSFFIKKKWVVLLFIIIVSFAILRMQIFTNILIGFLFSSLAMLSIKNRIRNSIIISFLAIIIILIPSSFYINALHGLSEITHGIQDVSYKFQEFAVYIEQGGNIKNNEFTYRASRFPMLFSAFINSPFLGCFYSPEVLDNVYKGEGGHLYWMNKLTVTGIIGFIFYASIIILFLKNQLNKMKGEFKYYFILSILSIIFYGLFKNVVGRDCWFVFFVIIPGMYYLPLLQKNRKDEIDKNL